MTTQSQIRRTTTAGLLTLALGAALVGCGGGGGGGGDGGGNGGGNENPTDAQLVACQTAVQGAGASALASQLTAAETCGAVVACQVRSDVDGIDPAACVAAAASACTTALDAVGDPGAAIAAALGGGQCATLAVTDLAATLGFDALAPRCATIGGGVDSKDALATCLGASVECAASDALAASAPLAPTLLAGAGVAFTAKPCGTSTVALHVGAVVAGAGGAIFDGIVDGFPGIAPQDGTPDIAGNRLGVGIKPGAVEERGIGEFPLAGLIGGLTADGITSAVLTFNIDDVLATFGPGTDFDGTAAQRIQIHTYSGDGTITLADFTQGNGTPAVTVTTGGQGAITDATLAGSGPVVFEVDLTTPVKALVQSGATHLGIVFVTDDTNSGTSLDDLGPSSSGPPGVGGAKLPFLTINGGGGPAPICGDGNPDPGEECDDGNTTPGDGCDGGCNEEPPPAACGNGVVDGSEECDDGAGNSNSAPDACRTNCRHPRCGDDVVDTGESCDDGSSNSNTAQDACRTTCTPARCGDGVVDTGEQCDPPGQSCTATCTSITVDAGAQFIACQEALLTAAATARVDAGAAIATCLEAEVGCTLADDPAGCHGAADTQCTAAAHALATARTDFRNDFPTGCVGRPPAELALELGLSSRLAACAAEGLPVTTLSDLADCVFRAAACPVTRAYGELAAGGSAALADRGAIPAEFTCAGAP